MRIIRIIRIGLSNIRIQISDTSPIATLIKQRLRHQYMHNWYASVRETSKLEYYCQFKISFCFEKYLDVIQNDLFRQHTLWR